MLDSSDAMSPYRIAVICIVFAACRECAAIHKEGHRQRNALPTVELIGLVGANDGNYWQSSPYTRVAPSRTVSSRLGRSSSGYGNMDSRYNRDGLTEHPQTATNYQPRTLQDFATRDSRLGFIRKVYAIFGIQITATIFITYIIMNNRALAGVLFRNFKALSAVTFLGSTGIIFAMVANPELRYNAPTNFILLGLHTVLQSFMVGTFSSVVRPRTVFVGALHTLSAFVAITLYSFQPNPKYDLTVFGNTLLTVLTSLLVGSIANIFLKIPLMDNLLSAGFAVLFAVYLFYDTQKIVGGRHHKYNYGQKEYILAALNLYQDVINLFIQIVSMLHENENRRQSE